MPQFNLFLWHVERRVRVEAVEEGWTRDDARESGIECQTQKDEWQRWLAFEMILESSVLYKRGVATRQKVLLTRAQACQSLLSDSCARTGGKTSKGKSWNGDLKALRGMVNTGGVCSSTIRTWLFISNLDRGTRDLPWTMLYLIGLGLSDECDITLRGLQVNLYTALTDPLT